MRPKRIWRPRSPGSRLHSSATSRTPRRIARKTKIGWCRAATASWCRRPRRSLKRTRSCWCLTSAASRTTWSAAAPPWISRSRSSRNTTKRTLPARHPPPLQPRLRALRLRGRRLLRQPVLRPPIRRRSLPPANRRECGSGDFMGEANCFAHFSLNAAPEVKLQPMQRKAYVALALLMMGSAVAALVLSWTAPGRELDQHAYDFLFRLESPAPWKPDSVILAIDEETLTKYGGITSIRAALTDGLRKIAPAHPTAVAVDVILPATSPPDHTHE